MVWVVVDEPEGDIPVALSVRERRPGDTRGVEVSAEVAMRYQAVMAAFDEMQTELEALIASADN